MQCCVRGSGWQTWETRFSITIMQCLVGESSAYSTCFSAAVINTITRSNLEWKGLRLTAYNLSWRKSGQELKAEPEAGTTQARCSLACSLWLAQCASHTTRDHLFRGSTGQGGLDRPTSITNRDNSPQTCLEANLTGTIFHLRFILPKWLKFMSRWQELASISGKKKTKAWFIGKVTTYNHHGVPLECYLV